MYPNLLGQKAYYKLTDEDMAKIINISRNAYMAKIRSGRFYPYECKRYCEYFKKSFDFLFATEDEMLSA